MALSLPDLHPSPASDAVLHLETLRVPRASELVADRLRQLIVLGTVRTGAMLPSEKELVAQLGVSRATLREALRRLETEGLIVSRPGAKGGSVVQRPGPTSLIKPLRTLVQIEDAPFSQMAEARRLIEPLCGQLAAGRATTGDLAEMDEAIAEMRATIGDQPAYLAGQMRFHLAVVAATHNPIMRTLTASLAELNYEYVREVTLSPGDCAEGAHACEMILAAIRMGDGATASRRIERHIRAVEAVVTQRPAL